MTESDRTEGDRALLARLEAAIGQDQPPAEVVAAAKAAMTWRTIDAELAALSYDSLDHELVGVRGAGEQRALTFEAGPTVIELEIGGTGTARHLEGQVVPAGVAELELQQLDPIQQVQVATDELGRFRADGLRPGPLRLLARFGEKAGGGTYLTEWVLL